MASPKTPRPLGFARVLRVIGWTVFALGVLVVDGLAVLAMPEGQDFGRFMVEVRLEERFKGHASLQSIEFGFDGKVELLGLGLSAPNGEELLHLDRLTLQLASVFPTDVGFDIESLEVSGLKVLQGHGKPRLRDLLIPKDEPRPERDLRIANISLKDIDVEVLRPDGTLIQLRDLAVTGHAQVQAGVTRFELEIPKGSGSLAITRADGSAFDLASLDLKVRGEVSKSNLDLEVYPFNLPLRADVPKIGKIDGVIALKSLKIKATKKNADVLLQGLKILHAAVDRFEGKLHFGPGATLEGHQEIKLQGLEIAAHDINRIAGREMVQGPVRADLEGSGTAEAIAIKGRLTSTRGDMDLEGTVNLSDPRRPKYKVRLSGSNLAGPIGKPLAPTSADVVVSLDGEGILPGEVKATLVCNIMAGHFGLPIKNLELRGRTDAGKMEFEIGVLKHTVKIKAERIEGTNRFKADLSTRAHLDELLAKLKESGILKTSNVALFGEELKVDFRVEGELPTDPAEGEKTPLSLTVKGVASAHGIRTEKASVDKVQLLADLSVNGTTPKGTVELRLSGVKAGFLRFDEVSFVLSVDGNTYTVDARASAPGMGEVASAKIISKVDVETGAIEARVEKLHIHHGPVAFELEEPLTFDLPPGLDFKSKSLQLPPLRLRVAGGWVEVDGNLGFEKGGEDKAFNLSEMDIKITLRNLSPVLPLTRMAQLTGGAKARINGVLRLQGRPDAPRVKFDLETRLGAYRIKAEGLIAGKKLSLAGELFDSRRSKVGSIRLSAPFDPQKKRPSGQISMDWDFKDFNIGKVLNLKAMAIPPEATLSGGGKLRGTLLHPEGDWRVSLESPATANLPAFKVLSQGRIESVGHRVIVRANGDHRIASLPAFKTLLVANFSHSPLTHPKANVTGTFALKPISVGKLSAQKVSGTLSALGSFSRKRGQVRAQGELRASRLKHPALTAPIDITTGFEFSPQGLSFNGQATTASTLLSRFEGQIRGDLLKAAKRKRLGSLPLAFRGETPTMSFGEIRKLIPALLESTGRFSGQLTVQGTVDAPVADGRWSWSGFRTANGTEGRITLALKGQRDRLTLKGLIGPSDAGAPISWSVTLEPTAEGKLKGGAVLAAKTARVADLLPAGLFAAKPGSLGGTLDGELRFGVEFDPKSKALRTTRADGEMRVDLDNLAVADTSRVFKGIHARVYAQPDGLVISPFKIIESDEQVSNRSLTLKGKLHWESFKPTRFEGRLVLDKWLSGGPFYAPHAQVDAVIALKADLTGPVPKVVVDIQSLKHDAPNRFLRDHHQEFFGHNDVVFIDDEAQIGKLPPSKLPLVLRLPKAGSGEKLDLKLPAVDVRILFSQPAELSNAPLYLTFRGDMSFKIRPDGVTTSGGIDVSKGRLAIMGQSFAYKEGGIELDGPLKNARVNLTFERAPNQLACREAAQGKEDCTPVEVTLRITPKRGVRLIFKGASGPYIVDAMALQNTGHGQYLSGPGKNTSSTVTFPQEDDFLIISWITSNVRYLTFLDRYLAHSDPTSLETYGQLRHYDAQRLLGGGTQRLRLSTRPEGVAQNQAQIGYDFFLKNTGRNILGVNVHTGDQLFTGTELFFEWSSEK